MGNTDSLPVVSQVKSTVQLVCGDTEGAAKTQENFLRECPVVSQVTSTVQLIAGDVDGAIETQKRCGQGLLNAADGIPVVGHAKGLVHYAVGDTEGGTKAMKTATRSTAVIGGGIGGFVVGGPVGAVAGGISAGAAMDTTTTVVESVIRDEYSPSGYLAAIDNTVKNPNPGDIFDLAVMPVFDGLAGYSAGQAYNKITTAAARKANNVAMSEALQKQGINAFEAGKAMEAEAWVKWEQLEAQAGKIPDGQYIQEAKAAQQMFNKAKLLQGEALVQPVKGPPQQVNVPIFVPGNATQHDKEKDDEEEEHNKKEVKIKVFYVNARKTEDCSQLEQPSQTRQRVYRTKRADSSEDITNDGVEDTTPALIEFIAADEMHEDGTTKSCTSLESAVVSSDQRLMNSTLQNPLSLEQQTVGLIKESWRPKIQKNTQNFHCISETEAVQLHNTTG
ncbi:unnamed protein product [Darwinula stevensoni]|uniref:Uncharacterized protein n=1 Tax=Darwinula stevensoni TaxID=69355 RepID=A0A7R9AEX7_9CRUS|nr:unnamed protein product [Darwinula stevensoni]CAG0902770.1 unnamed protein product [Darwinula stevensoni]